MSDTLDTSRLDEEIAQYKPIVEAAKIRVE